MNRPLQPRLNWNRAATCGAPAPGVSEAMLEGLESPQPGRGSLGERTNLRLNEIRRKAADYFGFGHPERVIFSSGLTASMNLALQGCIQPGQTVLTSRLEHNSVLRPLEFLRKQGVQILEAPFDASGRIPLDILDNFFQNHSIDWLVLTWASNVLGTVQPLAEAATLAKKHGAKVIADLAQGAGYLPIQLDEWGISLAGVPAHKGLHGPMGIGLLFVGTDVDPQPLLHGGTGSQGHLRTMPLCYPEKLEAGTPNIPGAFGLGAAVDWRAQHPAELSPVQAHLSQLESWLRSQANICPFPQEPQTWEKRLPILSFSHDRIAAHLLEAWLEQTGIQTRSGLLCSASTCEDLQVPNGILRLSPPLNATAENFSRVQTGLELAFDALQ
ncbi:MAG: aminotransferase class V-fold PLP-dependent enzyme [Planctomycetota bacterium]|nr:aminotransferase class V-fold PLP-dependent enzyme [Planctomycetota bacterium]MDP6940523.1 aminotransferase class V-fold PLP-dependent enzyme [Planctomycetota bacterium]